jgi:hypothetical protein
MTNFERRHCFGKFKYFSRKKAKRAAKAMRRKHHEPFGVYRCKCCDFFHVGHGKTRKIIRTVRRAA